MARRKPWNQLSANVQKRYLRNGITPAMHAQGASIQAARGHAYTPEHGGPSFGRQALANNIDLVVTDFAFLSRAEQNRVGKLWNTGFFTKGNGRPLTPEERIQRGIHPSDKRVYRKPSAEQVDARFDFQDWYREEYGEFDRNEWKLYRQAYMETFAAAS